MAVALLIPSGAALGADVAGIRMWPAPDKTRVVFDVSGPPDYQVFIIKNPDRVVLDLSNSRLTAALLGAQLQGGALKGVRSGKRAGGQVRVVLDVAQPVTVESFRLAPNSTYGHRLVVDLFVENPPTTAPLARPEAAPARDRDVVIAIDAGHGGEDPGARGSGGLREKDVVLQIARQLAKLVNAEPGMRAMMVRDGDYYVGLRQRIAAASKHRADLFISIHADAFKDKRVRGSSVYVLSRRGASSEAARWLADRENASDYIGGVSLQDKDSLLRSVLLDLSQTASMEASVDVAQRVLKHLSKVSKLHRRSVQHAGFVVLKSPDIPSVLVETAFISNPEEERKLRNAKHQQQMVAAILAGLRDYFRSYPPPGTQLALRRHTIARGDTLTSIAQRYRVSAESLRVANDLRGDRLLVGGTLRIP